MDKCDLWIALRNRGYSPYATAAILGNMQQESGFRSNNVEDRYHRDTGRSDEQYTAAVDNGSYTRADFMRDGGKVYGYGLCQWTYPTRKAGLYDLCKQRRVSISDTKTQLDYLDMELASHEYAPVKRVLFGDYSLYEMTKKFMTDFERPADQSTAAINYRVGLAQDIYNELSGVSLDMPGDGAADPVDPEQPEKLWPPRMLDEGMEGPDVQLYQAALVCHGYSVLAVNGIFDSSTTKAVKAYQKDHGLAVDGVIGPITGHSLLAWE